MIIAPEKTQMFKHFSPTAVDEVHNSKWDDKTKTIITPSGKITLQEELEAAAIPWLLYLKNLEIETEESLTAVTF